MFSFERQLLIYEKDLSTSDFNPQYNPQYKVKRFYNVSLYN